MRFSTSIRVAAVSTALMLGSTAAEAQVWNNGTPDNLNAWAVNSIYTTANDFTLTSAATLVSLNWWAIPAGGDSGPTSTSSYTVEFFADAAGTPGALITTIQQINDVGVLTLYGCCSGVATGTDAYHAYYFSASLGALNLAAGTYWVALNNDTNSNYWSTSAQVGNQLQNDGSGYYGAEGAFNLIEESVAVPEPASLVLLATGMVGIVGFARRRKTAA